MSIQPLAYGCSSIGQVVPVPRGGASRGALAKKFEKLVPRGRLQDWRKFPGIGTDGTSCTFAVQLHSAIDGCLCTGTTRNFRTNRIFGPSKSPLCGTEDCIFLVTPATISTRRAISAYLYETCTVAPCSSATEFQFVAITIAPLRQNPGDKPTTTNTENPWHFRPIHAPPCHVGSPPHVSLQCRPIIFGHNSLILGSILAASLFSALLLHQDPPISFPRFHRPVYIVPQSCPGLRVIYL